MVNGESRIDVGKCSLGVAGGEFNGRSQAQKLFSIGASAIYRIDFSPCRRQLTARVGFILQAAIESHQIHVQLDAVKPPFSWMLRQTRQSRREILTRVAITILEFGNLAAQRVQPVIVGIQSRGALEERICFSNRADGNLSLRSRQLQTHILWLLVGCPRKESGGL